MEPLIQISIIIPVFGNEKTLKKLTQQITSSLEKLTFEIIFVNDASTDNSLDLIIELSQNYSQIKYLNLSENKGQQLAILEGMRIAIGEKIVVLDADLQDNPIHIKQLLGLHNNSGEAIFILREGIYQSLPRMITSILLKIIIQGFSGLNYKAGSYYLTDRKTIANVIPIASKCSFPYLSILVAFQAHQIKYLKAKRGKNYGNSGYNFTKRLLAGYRAIRCCLFCHLN
ncbi:glycosyltransferase [Flexithrix dorotheae]|uniref:glycosyltransferase n=1 Tax=Flexithrix dorotheae TaxID=70993 RepID=UPI00037EC0C8|nr:glycosyltransferase [Flexithrix dorotheae]